jgi:hypothetical protein
MTVVSLAGGIVALARALLLAFAAKHRGIQVQGKALGRTAQQAQRPAPERTSERLDVPLRKAQKEVADGIVAGKARDPQQRVQNPVGPQPLRMSKTLRAGHHRHHKGRQRVPQRDGIVGGRFRKGQKALHLASETNLAQKGNEAGQSSKRRDGLGRLFQYKLGMAKERANFGAGRFVQGRVDLLRHKLLYPQPSPQSDPFFYFRVRILSDC